MYGFGFLRRCYLQIQMNHVVFVHESDAIADLPSEKNAVLLGEGEIIRHDALEQLTTSNTENHNKRKIANLRD